ncbi:MAG: hypothetical protein L0H74_05940 [Brachybacterium sp.]|nr:hypothetical protein [Brachybacterium sp.]
MLFDVDHQARQLLMDVEADDAGPMLRGWSPMVTAAEELWAALPRVHAPGMGPEEPMRRLSAHAKTIEISLNGHTTAYSRGPVDTRMTQMAQTLHSAATLISRYGQPPVKAEAYRDLEAARSRVMHGLYITSHAISVALHSDGRNRFQDSVEQGRPLPVARHHSPYAVAPTGTWLTRISSCERAAGDYFKGGLSDSLGGEAVPPMSTPNRLERALAHWDIQAHRSLANDPTAMDIAVACRTEGLIAGASLVLTAAASEATEEVTGERFGAAVEQSGQAWSNLANRWHELTSPDMKPDLELLHAAADVRAAYRELTHNHTTLATPQEIASRPGLDAAVRATRDAFHASADLAHVVAERGAGSHLTGAAWVLARRVRDDVESGMATPERALEEKAWVSPADIVAKRTIPMPAPAADGLRAASRITVTMAERTAATVGARPGAGGAVSPVGARHLERSVSPAPAVSSPGAGRAPVR